MKAEPFVLLVQIYTSLAVHLKINGDVTFDLKLSHVDLNQSDESLREGAAEMMRTRAGQRVTAGPPVECLYQYPETEQIDAILSNMMNELTKVFVQANGLLAEDGRRRPDTRFRVIDRTETQFFDHIYSNMTDEYSKFYNNTTYRVQRSARDPCRHQQEVKQVWSELLDYSLATFRTAALRCADHLRAQRGEGTTGSRLRQFIMRAVAKIRSNQLDMLCERFQLCYSELL